jgi:type I restriction enzyme, R subunit
MVGLNREAAKRAFDAFLAGRTLTANQSKPLHFVNLLVDYLTQSGWMSPAQLYESPFTDFSPRGMFNSLQVTQLLSVLDSIRQTAAVPQ